MKIIPYFIDYAKVEMKTLDMHLVRLRVLLEGGKKIWEDLSLLSDKVNFEIEENDIYGDITFDDDNQVAWVKVNEKRTPLSDFYTYEEVTDNHIETAENALLWRTFRTLVDNNLILHPDLPEHTLFRELIKKTVDA
jgi:hypothetical protein